jgi:transcriptional regulator with XRE-family HTH domain
MVGLRQRGRRADALDAEIGRRIRARRIECGMSQTALGNQLGISFQQLQKYEKGVNRVAAGRLQRICQVLQVPITFFYDPEPASGTASGSQVKKTKLFDLLQRRDAVELVTAFGQIRERTLRRALVQIVVAIATPESSGRR